MDNPRFSLCEAILALKTSGECMKFLNDLLTPQEMVAIANRWEAALLLEEGLTQRTVVERIKVSLATVSRVNRALTFGDGGYRLVIERLRESISRNG